MHRHSNKIETKTKSKKEENTTKKKKDIEYRTILYIVHKGNEGIRKKIKRRKI